ncbi:MAG: mannose-1-phosphate guanylyltransferase [Oscillospiraceae bacterium]|nr:mannose-1-phosphate guanylyltransferase [Oscillospiraceae bacterium]
MKITAVIMAGGKGERFWPQSRANRPKQFLSLTNDGETMIQKTVARLTDIVDINDVFVVTNENYIGLVKEQLTDLPDGNIIAEPKARNTAPCIALAAQIIKKKYGDAVMMVLPSDHLIKFTEMYVDTLRKAIEAAEKDKNLVTIGITPSYPETGYGYIQFSDMDESMPGAYKVARFVEKPNIELAKEYVNSGTYLWNSGMFVWKASSIIANIEQFLPDVAEGSAKIGETYGTDAFDSTLKSVFPELTAESIDFGVMEKAKDIYTIPGNFGWDDVGSWLAVERVNGADEYGNVEKGDIVSINTKNSTLIGGKRLVAAVGLEDIVVVDTDDALLICAKDSTQDIKKIIESLKNCNRNELV